MASYYEILGISNQASSHEIKIAFRDKAKMLHPDINGTASAQKDFQEINEAYQVLIDPRKRRIYDLRLKNRIVITQTVYYTAQQPKNQAKEAYRRAYYAKRKQEQEYVPGPMYKFLDLILFLSLLGIGLFAFFFGLHRLLNHNHNLEERDPTAGIILGLVFSSLLIFIWVKKNRIFR